MSDRTVSYLLIIGGILLNILFLTLSINKVEPFHRFFYCFAWWSILLAVSGLNNLLSNKEFTMFQSREFINLCLISTFVWLTFELINIRVKNWEYHNIPIYLFIGVIFGWFAFATVLPAIFGVGKIFEKILKINWKPLNVSNKALYICLLAGIILFVVLLVHPPLFFPLMWLCFIFICEPLNKFLFGKTPLLSNPSILIPLLISGSICGILWETWNSLSGMHWRYTVPLPDELQIKIFEMPILGYFGFPIFAVESYTMYHFVNELTKRVKQKLILIFCYLLFCLTVFMLITEYTVKSFK